jgi:hypothetical protein
LQNNINCFTLSAGIAQTKQYQCIFKMSHSNKGEKRMKKAFVLLLTVLAFNTSLMAYADEANTSEALEENALPEGVAPLPEFVEAD